MKKIFLLLLFCIAVGKKSYAQFTATLSGFPLVTTGWNIGGFGAVVDSTVRLTTASTDENGYVYYDSAVNLTACSQFVVKFDYKIAPSVGTGVADGIAFFYIATPPSGFITGGGLGLPTPLQGMVFTLDTWDNDGDALNPESQLFGYTSPSTYTEGDRSNMLGPILPHLAFMDDASWHHCEIDYVAGTITVYYDYSPVASMTAFYVITIPAGYFGFSSSTGAAISTQSVKNLVITVKACFSADNSSAICQGDSLQLDAVSLSDTIGATYFWYGPNGFTSTLENPVIYSTVLADSGVYTVVKTIGTIHDTATTDAVIKRLPVVTATSNGPICSGNTLNLFADPDSTGETFTWTGPDGFTSLLQDPSVTVAHVPDGGTYKVVTVWNGCTDSGTVNVVIDSTPVTPTASNNTPICSGAGNTLRLSATDLTRGVRYSWVGPAAFGSTLQNPTVADAGVPYSGTYTVTATLLTPDGLACSSSNTTDALIDSTPFSPVLGSNSPVCSGNPLLLTALSTALGVPPTTYNWTGPNSFTAVVQNPTINPVATNASGTYSASATIFYPGIPLGCSSGTSSLVVEVDSTPAIPIASSNSPGPPGSTICQYDTLKLIGTDATAGVTYSWVGPDLFTSTLQNPIITNVAPAATGSYTLTAILGSCSSSAVAAVVITPAPPLTATNNGPVCTGVSDTLLLQATSGPGATYSWTGPYTFFSANQNPYRTPVGMEYAGVYKVTAFLNGCASATVNDTVEIRQTPAPPIVAWLTYCQFYPPAPLQAMGDSILWYPTDTAHGVGSLVVPTPSTDNTGISWFYTSQTIMGCTSYLDSIKVVVNPKPVLSVSNDTSICPHDSVTLVATDTDPLITFHWGPQIFLNDTSGPVVVSKPESEVHYTIVATNQFDCTDTAHVAVSVSAAAVVNTGDSVTLYPGESYQIPTQTNCTSFAWYPPSGLDNSMASSPVASPLISTKYLVFGETSWGCKTEDSISIFVNTGVALALPNAFTPGSGPNNQFKIIKNGVATLQYFRIFDRWGVKVFETTDIDAGWDGTYNGTPQPFGVYVYEVQAVTNTGDNFEKHGNVTLLR